MKTTLVIHHSADFDGICSREIARKALGETATYLGWDYGQPIPDLAPYDTVYMIDISLPIEVMNTFHARIILIDHHKSCIEKTSALISVFQGYYCIDGVAACRLAWQYFNLNSDAAIKARVDAKILTLPDKQDYIDRKVSEPYAVQLLGEFDIWDKRNPDVDLFQLGMQAQKTPNWEKLFTSSSLIHAPGCDIPSADSYTQWLIDSGRIIKQYTEVVNAEIITGRGFDVVFEGLTFRALNIARCNSLTFTAAIKEHHECCLAYHWNGSKWRFSLYHVDHRKDIDLSLIAVKYGGGGHRGACGFEMDNLPESLGGFRFLDKHFAGQP